MSPPALSHTAQRLYDALEPFAAEDEVHEYALAVFCSALAAGWDRVGDLSRDQDDGAPGFTCMFDPSRCPAWLLPWAAQFVGVEMLPGLTEDQQRTRFAQTGGFQRGTPDAMVGAARQWLVPSDTATVYLNERQGGPYRLGVATLAAQTPDSSAVLRALLEQKPGGLKLTYLVLTGGEYGTLQQTHTDYNDIHAQFATYDAMRADPSLT